MYPGGIMHVHLSRKVTVTLYAYITKTRSTPYRILLYHGPYVYVLCYMFWVVYVIQYTSLHDIVRT